MPPKAGAAPKAPAAKASSKPGSASGGSKPASAASSPPKSADPKAGGKGTKASPAAGAKASPAAGAKAGGAKAVGAKAGGGKQKKAGAGSDSDSESSQGSVKSNSSKSSTKSNRSVKSNSSTKTDKTSKASKSTTKSAAVTEIKGGVKEVSGQQLMAAVNDFDKKSLTEYIDAHTAGEPLSEEVVNFKNNGGNTPLMMACQKPKDADAEALVKMLLNLRPVLNLNHQSRTGNTALHYACKDQGLPATVSLLLDAGADFQIKNADGHLPSDLAKDRRIVQALKHYLDLRLEAQRRAAIAEIGVVLYEAVAAGDAKKVQTLINRDPPEETYSYYPEPMDQNQPPLRLAVDRNFIEIVRMLVAAGADGKQADRLGRTPTIHLCAQKRVPSYPTTKLSRDTETVRWNLLNALLDGPLTHLECRDKNGETAFHHASNNAYYDDMKLLVDVGADVNARQISPYPYRGYPNQRANHGDTALIVATRKGDFATVKVLIEDCKADVNLHGAEDMTALMWAAWHDRKELIGYLFSKGANLNAQSYFGQTALMWTMEHMRIETAMFLLDLGHEPPEPAPPAVAVAATKPDQGKGGKGGKQQQQPGKGGKGGKGGPPEPPPPEPKTPGLPPRAADPNIVTKNNASPLIVLCRKSGNQDPKLVSACIDLLVSRGADVDIRSTDGLTALMWGVLNNDKDICRQLLFVGANPTIKDNLKHTPMDALAPGAPNSQVIKMLLKSAVEAFNEEQEAKAQREREEAEEKAAALAAATAPRAKTPTK